MSLGYSSNNVVGGPIDPKVKRQLDLRKEVVSKTTSRTDSDVQYLTGNSSWVRVTSSVDAWDNENKRFTPDLAKKYQLYGGTLRASGGFNPGSDNSSYVQSDEYGFVPTPGITNFQVQAQGEFGTLRAASFNFTVHSPEDFDKLEQIYLRPGFTILLEWGHSVYLSNDGGLETTVRPFSLETFSKKLSGKAINKKIDELRGDDENKSGHSFNYDAMFGYIKNFTWSYNGVTYECQVDVISKGEIIESIKSTMAPLHQFNTDPSNKEYKPAVFASEIECFLHAIKHAPYQDISFLSNIAGNSIDTTPTVNYLEAFFPELTSNLLKVYERLGKKFQLLVNNLGQHPNNYSYPKYITLRSFLILINEATVLYADNEPVIQFYVGEGKEVSNFTTFYEHIGLNQDICILPKASKRSDSNFFLDISNQASIGANEENDILNIFLSVDYLISVFEDRKKNKTSTNNTLYDVLVSDVLLDIEKNLGGINQFDLHPDINDSLFYVVDRKVVPPGNQITTLIDLVGLRSELLNLSINSRLTNDMSSMIAIAAQDVYTPTSAEELFNIQKWNRGLRNRHFKNTKIGRNNRFDPEEVDNIQKSIETQFSEYIDYINNIPNELGAYEKPSTEDLGDIHKELMNQFVRKYTSDSRNTNPPGLIPFELSFTIKGIAGFKIGQAFKISEFFLPERYKGNVAFIIVGIDHAVTGNIWTTQIRAQMIKI